MVFQGRFKQEQDGCLFDSFYRAHLQSADASDLQITLTDVRGLLVDMLISSKLFKKTLSSMDQFPFHSTFQSILLLSSCFSSSIYCRRLYLCMAFINTLEFITVAQEGLLNLKTLKTVVECNALFRSSITCTYGQK